MDTQMLDLMVELRECRKQLRSTKRALERAKRREEALREIIRIHRDGLKRHTEQPEIKGEQK